MFNLNDAEPIPESAYSIEEPKLDFSKIDEQRFAKKEQVAQSAITPEMLKFEQDLQRLHVEQVIPKVEEIKLEKEENTSIFLGDYVEDYKPAKTIVELDNQAFTAQQMGATAIEASEEIVKHYTKPNYPPERGYFIYKNVKVFIPGRLDGYIDRDRQNIGAVLRGLPG